MVKKFKNKNDHIQTTSKYDFRDQNPSCDTPNDLDGYELYNIPVILLFYRPFKSTNKWAVQYSCHNVILQTIQKY